MQTNNPALKEGRLTRFRAAAGEPVMTVQGTAGKSLVLLALVVFAASFTWQAVAAGNTAVLLPSLLVGGLGGFVVAMIATFRPQTAPWAAPLYAVLEGLVVGAISAIYDARFRGIPMQAVALTFGVFAVMLVLYRTRVIRVTDRLRTGIVAATGGIALAYLLSMVLSLFGVSMSFMRDASPLSIGISLFVVGVAALNLMLDFDMIEQGAAYGAPKAMEWYASFGLLVTLVWLYMELLRLLSKLQSRNRS